MKASTSKAPKDISTKIQSKYRYSQRNPRPCGHCARLQVRVRTSNFLNIFSVIYLNCILTIVQCIITPPLGSAVLCHRCRRKGLSICPPYVPRTKRLESNVAVEEEVILLQTPYTSQHGSPVCGSPQSEVKLLVS